jgi:hypothetical protein
MVRVTQRFKVTLLVLLSLFSVLAIYGIIFCTISVEFNRSDVSSVASARWYNGSTARLVKVG